MPTTPTLSGPTRSHSCDLAYFKSAGTFDMTELSQGVASGSNSFLSGPSSLHCENVLPASCRQVHLLQNFRRRPETRSDGTIQRLNLSGKSALPPPPPARVFRELRFQSPCPSSQTPAARNPSRCRCPATDFACR